MQSTIVRDCPIALLGPNIADEVMIIRDTSKL